MKIPQPTRQGETEARAFHAICPSCGKLLSIDDGKWPEHLWSGPESLTCPTAGYPHATVVRADGGPVG